MSLLNHVEASCPATAPRGLLLPRCLTQKPPRSPTSAAHVDIDVWRDSHHSTLHSGLQHAPGCLHSESDTLNLRERPSLCLFPSVLP